MTDEELEKKAERYARNSLSTLVDTVIQDNVKLAYIKGAKENAPVWHKVEDGDMPIIGTCVIVYWERDDLFHLNGSGVCCCTYECIEEYYKDSGKDFVGFMDGGEPFGLNDYVVAWQYLPIPPKEAEK